MFREPVPIFETPEQYVGEKVLMLIIDFKIKPSSAEIDMLSSYENEFDIDLAVRKIIKDHWTD